MGQDDADGARAPAAVDAAAAADPAAARRARRDDVLVPVAVAAAAKVVVLAIAYQLLGEPSDFWHRLAWQWDGFHYLSAANGHYQRDLEGPGTSAAFAFLYPMLVRALGGSATAAVALSNTAALLAVAVVAWHWGRKAGLALALFPSWIVFGTAAYSEGLYVLLAATALAALERGRRAVGGLAAAAAACARYFGGPALLVAALPVGRGGRWREPRQWLLVVVIGVGGIGLWLWLASLTGSSLSYVAAQRHDGARSAWPWEHFDYLLHGWYTNQGGPVAPWGNFAPIEFFVRDVGFTVVVGAGLALLWLRRAPWPTLAYTTLAFLSAYCVVGIPATALPRYLLAAFPAIGALGTRLEGRLAWATYAGVALAVAVGGMCRFLFAYWS